MKFREMLARNQAYLAPAVFNPLSAKLAEQAGFQVLYLSGGALGQKLVLDLDRAKPCYFRRLHRESDMHGIAPSADPIHDEWQFARRPDLDSCLDDVCQAEVGFQRALDVTKRPAA